MQVYIRMQVVEGSDRGVHGALSGYADPLHEKSLTIFCTENALYFNKIFQQTTRSQL